MKLQSLAILILIVGASCSSPKYTYNFSYYDYQAGKKKAIQPETSVVAEANQQVLTASTASTSIVYSEVATPKVETIKDFSSMNKSEQKSFKKEIKNNIKEAVRNVKKLESKSVQAAQGWDSDLKMAAIFGAIGLVLGALIGINNIIGFIGFVAIVIALVFLIKWLLRQ